VEITQVINRLDQLPLGGRLLVRSKKDWRVAVVSHINDERIVLSVASPRGGCYRLRRPSDTEIGFDGRIPFLKFDCNDVWRENFTKYDARW